MVRLVQPSESGYKCLDRIVGCPAVSCVCLQGDAKTAKLTAVVRAAGGTWRDVAALTEPQLAATVREDGVDVLVELAGHTANNRLGVVAMRPAPVQVPSRRCIH